MSKFIAKSLRIFVIGTALTVWCEPSKAIHMIADLERQNRQCLQVPGSFEETRSAGVRTAGATESEKDLVNRAVARINILADGGRFRGLSGLDVVFKNNLRSNSCVPASQVNGFVEVGRRCHVHGFGHYRFEERGCGLLVHEIGHFVGNRGGYRGYPGGCKLSAYSHASRNEEFAEVFAAYVVNPDLLRRTASCSPAYSHMRRLFRGPSPAETCSLNRVAAPLARASSPQFSNGGAVMTPRTPAATRDYWAELPGYDDGGDDKPRRLFPRPTLVQ